MPKRTRQIRNGYTIGHRGDSWQAVISRDLTRSGKRLMICRATKAEVEVAAQCKIQELNTYGSEYLNFTPKQLHAAGEAFRELADKGFAETALMDAVKYFMAHNDPKDEKRTVESVLVEFLESKQSAGLSEFTIKDYREKLSRFSISFGKRYIHSITPTELEGWLNSIKAYGVSRQGYRRHLSIFWRYAVGRKYAKENVAAAVTKIKVKRKDPTILAAQEVRSLLFAARDYNRGGMLPYFAIGCFCGLRPWELRRTSWANVKFDTKEIYITPDACKTSQDRYVSMPENLLAWLALVPESARKGNIHYSRQEFDAIRKNAGLSGRWSSDVMRHSAASHLYAATQNAATTTAQMGHGLNVFMRHYKSAVTKAGGEAYFKVVPSDLPTGNALR